MHKEELNNIMNCNCCQTIIEHDEIKHNINIEKSDKKLIQNILNVQLLFNTKVRYSNHVSDLKTGALIKNKREVEFNHIPILYCPMCGEKTNYKHKK